MLFSRRILDPKMRALSLICKPLLPRILFIAFIILCTPAAVSAQQLSSRHWQRVEEARLMIEEVESRPAEQILEAFNRAPAPEANLQIYEAVALAPKYFYTTRSA